MFLILCFVWRELPLALEHHARGRVNVSPGNREAPTPRKSWDYGGGPPELTVGVNSCRKVARCGLQFAAITFCTGNGSSLWYHGSGPLDPTGLKILVSQLSFVSDLLRWMQAYDPQDGDGALDFSEFLGSKVQGRVDWVDHQHDISRTYVIDIWIFEVCGLHHRRQTTNMYGLTTYDGNDESVIYSTLMKDSVLGAGAKKTVDPPEAAEVKVPKLSVLCFCVAKQKNQQINWPFFVFFSVVFLFDGEKDRCIFQSHSQVVIFIQRWTVGWKSQSHGPQWRW